MSNVRINKLTKVMTVTSGNGSRKPLGKVGTETLMQAISRLSESRRTAALEALAKFNNSL